MKINHIDGSVTDTDKLPDLSAELAEKIKEFTDFCCKHKIPFFMRVNDKTIKKWTGASNFNSSPEDYYSILDSINHFFKTNGNYVKLVLVKDEE